MLLMIDNYDSFTFNLVQYLQELGAEVRGVRNDALGVDTLAQGAAEQVQALIARLRSEAPPLALARGLDPRSGHLRRLAAARVDGLLVIHPRHLDVDVDPVQQWTRQALLVTADRRHVASTFVLGISKPTTGTGIHSTDKHKISRKAQRPLRAANGHDLVLQWLAQGFQVFRSKFGQLVQKEHPTMRQADLPRPRQASTTDQPGIADGMVRRTEGPLVD